MTAPLGGSRRRSPARHILHDVLLEEAFEQRQDRAVADRARHQRHQPVVRDAVEIALQVGIHHPGVALLEQPIDFPQRVPRFRERRLLQLCPGRKP